MADDLFARAGTAPFGCPPPAVTPLNAALLVRADYRERSALNIVDDLSLEGVQVTVADLDCGGWLAAIIRGTDETEDWPEYNFSWWPRTARGDTTVWHGGFLRYAQYSYSFLKPFRSRLSIIAGHSLGAAAAQVAGPALRVQTIALASPRPLRGTPPPGAEFVTNYCRQDDLVCALPPWWLGFEHVGPVVNLEPDIRRRRNNHRVEHYLPLLETLPPAAVVAAGRVA